MIKKQAKNSARVARHKRVRKKLSGTPGRPRMAVYRSGKHIYAQFIDDASGTTLAAASSLDKSLRSVKGTFVDRARQVGELAAERATKAGIETVIFDRGGYKYHGKVAALADGAREKGLRF